MKKSKKIVMCPKCKSVIVVRLKKYFRCQMCLEAFK